MIDLENFKLQSRLIDLHKHTFAVHFFEPFHFLNTCPQIEECFFTSSRTLISSI